MIMNFFNMLLLQIVVVIIVDISDFPSTLKKLVSFILTKGKFKTDNYQFHLADCSFCIQWWTNLIYIICIGQFSIPYIAFALFLSVMCPISKDIILLIRDIFVKLINKFYE